ncbi:MAG: PTS lactose/cellobiose transporter subunit IIA [Faecalibacterium prausnitzii]
MSDKMVEVAMSIIINAGDARTCAADAMQAELQGRPRCSRCKAEGSRRSNQKGAQCADRCDQDECRGNPTELSLLFMHARDTVMTIISEVSMIRLMIQMNRNLEDKINGNRN